MSLKIRSHASQVVHSTPTHERKYTTIMYTTTMFLSDAVIKKATTGKHLPPSMSDEVIYLGKERNGTKFIECHYAYTEMDNMDDSPIRVPTVYHRVWIPSNELFDTKQEGVGNNLSATKFVQQTVWDYFVGKGFSKIQVAGIMGNMMQESSWNPLRLNPNINRWGLVQNGRDHSLKIEALYRAAGLDMTLYGYAVRTYQNVGGELLIAREDLKKILQIQLDYIFAQDAASSNYEWTSSLKRVEPKDNSKASIDIALEKATESFLVFFEGAQTGIVNKNNTMKYYSTWLNYQEAEQRRQYAKEMYDLFSTNP